MPISIMHPDDGSDVLFYRVGLLLDHWSNFSQVPIVILLSLLPIIHTIMSHRVVNRNDPSHSHSLEQWPATGRSALQDLRSCAILQALLALSPVSSSICCTHIRQGRPRWRFHSTPAWCPVYRLRERPKLQVNWRGKPWKKGRRGAH